MTQRTLNFLELYFEAIDENIEEVLGDLNDAGIDAAESQNRLLQLIKHKKANLKIDKAKKVKEKVQNLLKNNPAVLIVKEPGESLALAYRKLGKLSPEEEAMIKKDSALLDEIEETIKNGANET